MSDDRQILEAILEKVTALEERVEELSEQNEQLREAISDFGLEGSGYSVFRPEDD